MPEPGQEITDPVTDSRLRFLRTSASTGGKTVEMELTVEAGWSAGPMHVHPHQSERVRVVAGRFRAELDGRQLELSPGDEVEVPPETSHTIELKDAHGALDVAFTPALRTDDLFETMYSATSPRRPPDFVPSAIRAWVESRGFAAEIRYLWPRRLALAGALTGLAVLLVSGRRRLA
jgi:mannose-6-phosphate isomerase-like protein (cupin superfamily)